VPQTYFQKGFGLKAEVGPILVRSYHSVIVDQLRALGHDALVGGLRLKIAREFGFCYGVDRAVEYAYETRRRFPDRRLFLSGEIIHNQDVNRRLREMAIAILPDVSDPAIRYADVTAADVVILPAFGVPVSDKTLLDAKGCVLVDTTCGSVLNVWKMVHRCARDGYTVVIHGKHCHEETRATASQALATGSGHYLCVRNVEEADVVCEFIRGHAPAETIRTRFGHASSPGFDPDVHLSRIGLANQTTMLMSESLEIQERLRNAMRTRHGDAGLASRFRAFDTICSATQDRQDAVRAMLEDGGLDLMIVIGGYNSSNTQALAGMCAPQLPTYHIEGAHSLDVDVIRHRPVGQTAEATAPGWLTPAPLAIGLTAGASTPDSVVGGVIERLLALHGCTVGDLMSVGTADAISDWV